VKKRNIQRHLRKGPLSIEDKRNIQDWVTFKTPEEMARDLNRSPSQIKRYRDQYLANAPAVVVKRSEADEFIRELHAGSNWLSIKEQFTDKELTFYENMYVNYRQQFKDMTSTELTQLYHMITLEVFMNRHNLDRRKIQEEIDVFEKFLQKERDLPEGQRDILKLTNMENTLLACRGASGAKTKEYKDLLDKHSDIMKTLKGTRDQRIKNIEDRGKFIGILKDLEVADRRKAIGEITSLMDLATAEEKERLSQPHQYMDKTIDQPLLNADTVLDDEE
jgi:hypothetical protein